MTPTNALGALYVWTYWSARNTLAAVCPVALLANGVRSVLAGAVEGSVRGG